jgi:hypothetical protein
LGLAICKSLVEKFMGEINVDSRIDKGSKFTFRIMVQDIKPECSFRIMVQDIKPECSFASDKISSENAPNFS